MKKLGMADLNMKNEIHLYLWTYAKIKLNRNKVFEKESLFYTDS